FNFYYYLRAQGKLWLWRLGWQIVNLWSPRVKTILINYFKADKPDLVISSNLMGLGFGAVKAIRAMGLKHIHILHDVQLLQPSGLFAWNKRRDSILEKIYQWFTKRIFNEVGVVVSPSVWLIREHERRGFFIKSVKQVLPNPVPLKLVSPIIEQTMEGVKEILYVGQAAEHKGVSWLIKTLQQSNLTGWRLRLVLWADKSTKQSIDKLIKNDKRFEVAVDLSQKEIDSYIAKSYLVIMPSLCCENYPTVIIKALSLGRPVLAAQSGGVPEIIKSNINGWLFRPGDGEGFLAILNNLLQQPDLVNQAAKGAVENSAGLSLEEYAANLLSLVKASNLA
ncbi:MAG: glycosyltransferase, partial [Patescibacteria group bacterium]